MDNIIPYSPDLKSHFVKLNEEWLEKYFYLEEHDKDLLNNCQEVIINKGGFIFFYTSENRILGTFALIRKTERIYELGKMAVLPIERGNGIGQKMLQYCIDFAQSKNWEKIVLYSSTKLKNSIYIYKKFGFTEIPIEKENPYARGDIKMELVL